MHSSSTRRQFIGAGMAGALAPTVWRAALPPAARAAESAWLSCDGPVEAMLVVGSRGCDAAAVATHRLRIGR